MLELREVSAHYGKNQVVGDASVVLKAGEVVALIGANAAGKSTTMRLIAGLKEPTRGTILFGGQDITGLYPRRVASALASSWFLKAARSLPARPSTRTW